MLFGGNGGVIFNIQHVDRRAGRCRRQKIWEPRTKQSGTIGASNLKQAPFLRSADPPKVL